MPKETNVPEPKPRMTKQRIAVLRTLEEDDSFRSAQQVHQTLLDAGETVGLATVYRNLQSLEEAGRVDTVRAADGELLFRLCEEPGHHHHLVCEKCGRTEEIDLKGVEELLVSTAAKKGYSLTTHELELYGTCSNCQ